MYQTNKFNTIYKTNIENDIPDPIESDNHLLELILMAIEDETSDILKYKTLSDLAPDQESKEILKSIYLDETRHKKLFQEIYSILSGTEAPEVQEPEVTIENYSDEISGSVLDEIDAARFYRDIYIMLDKNAELSGIVNGIMNDEQNHAILLNHLVSANNK